MPSHGSNRSSLKKMDYNHSRYGGSGGGKRFDLGNIVGDPFSLATIAIAIVSFHASAMPDYGLEKEHKLTTVFHRPGG